MDQQQSQSAGMHAQQEIKVQRQSFLHKAVFFLAVTIVVVFALWIVNTYIFSGQSSGYQAVFLSNGDVYFGHLEKRLGNEYVKLTHVYYLQVDSSASETEEATSDNTQFNLVKLGNEIHGPKDAMLINKDHILFIEDLQDNSEVVQSMTAQ